MKSLLAESVADLGKQRVFAGFGADAQIIAVRFGEPGALETFPRTSLEVIDRRKIAEGGDIIHEELQGFAAPLDTPLEFRIGLNKEPRAQIGPAKFVATDPCVQQV